MSNADRVCTSWRDLPLSQAEHLLQISDDHVALEKTLFEIVTTHKNWISMTTTCKQARIVAELYRHIVTFSNTLSLSPEQLSALFSILKDVHCVCVSCVHDNTLEAVQLFQHMIVCHSVNRPPYSIKLFSLAEVKVITDYVLNTYFKHYRLYKFAFTKRMCLDFRVQDEEVTPDHDLSCTVDTVEPLPLTAEAVDGEQCDNSSEDQKEEDPIKLPSHLQMMVSTALSETFKELKACVEKRLENQEQKMFDRLSALEKVSLNKSVPKNN